jgi:hypothetical protein
MLLGSLEQISFAIVDSVSMLCFEPDSFRGDQVIASNM